MCAFESCIRWHSLLVLSVTCAFEGSVFFFPLTHLFVAFTDFFSQRRLTQHAGGSVAPHTRARSSHAQTKETCAVSKFILYGYQVSWMFSNYNRLFSCTDGGELRKLQHYSLSTHGRTSEIDRGMLLSKEGGLNKLY